ncbi:3'-5' exonuclease [Mucilaginibacter lacusdianchii]|uniref:3'-5' exonuclease n=1 Tax=Mucilaginibacter lacusdianchii TaxID=2684211 RepID=UPI00131AFCA4|nr:3'-5' exonuclease [Mucilaginibacter sp. JXJ CY 39]
MNDYLLFVDTETSGLPVNWTLPYSAEGNWPSAVQVSWIIYTKEGTEVKREDHYIRNDDFFITPKAMEIHGINPGFLAIKGEQRQKIMTLLAADLNQYKPLVVGHFVQLDYHVLNADFYRAGIQSPLPGLPLFCTMTATTRLVWNPMPKSMLLGDLYNYLFYKPLQNQHNAAADAQATAECFFELLKRQEINQKSIDEQQKVGIKEKNSSALKILGFTIPFLILILVFLLT